MLNLRFKKVVIKLSSVILIISLLFSFFAMSSISSVSADSNSRRAALIDFARKKNLASVEDLASLTYDDLRVVGLFLSNFYTPYATALGTSESADGIKESLVNVLINTCNFSKDVATVLVSLVWDMSMKTAQPLYISKIDDGGVRVVDANTQVKLYMGLDVGTGDNLVNSDCLTTEIKDLFRYSSVAAGYEATAITFLYTLTGYGAVRLPTNKYDNLSAWTTYLNKNGKKTDSPDFILNDTERNCLYWVDSDGNKHIVWDSSLGTASGDSIYTDRNTFTTSSLAYALVCHSLDYSNGYAGNSVFTLEDFEDRLDTLSDTEKNALGVSGQHLFVDCFGNILVNTGVDCCVLLPACSNPYSWYSTGSGVSSAGSRINLCTLPYVAEVAEYKNGSETGIAQATGASTGKDLYWGVQDAHSQSESVTKTHWNVKLDNSTNKGGGLFKPVKNYWYTCKGNSNTTVDKEWINGDKSEEFRLLAKKNVDIGVSTWGDESVRFTGDMSSYLWDDSSTLLKSVPMSTFEKFLAIDNLGVLSSSTGGVVDTIIKDWNIFDYLFSSNKSGIHLINDPKSKIASGALTTLSGGDASVFAVSIYLSYIFAMYDTGSNSQLGWAYNKDNFPSMTEDLSWSSIIEDAGVLVSDTNKEEMMSFVYWLMHPVKGVAYFATMITNKLSGMLVEWHEDIVGKSAGSSSVGAVKYTGFSGYVTIPELDDIAWTDWILDQYDSLVIFFIIIISVIMLCYAMLGELTVQRALLGVLMFSICSYLPPTLINATVGVSNKVCDSLYSQKFTYWALVQHQEYVDDIANAVDANNESIYLATILKNQAGNTDTNSTNVSVKWMTPKKENYLADVNEELSDRGVTGTALLRNMLGTTLSGESFVDAEDALYLYRSYTDLGSYVTYAYGSRPDIDARGYMSPDDDTVGLENVVVKALGGTTTLYDTLTSYTKDGGIIDTAVDNGFAYSPNPASYVTEDTTGIKLYRGRVRLRGLLNTNVTSAVQESHSKLEKIGAKTRGMAVTSRSSYAELGVNLSEDGLVGLSDKTFDMTLSDINRGDFGDHTGTYGTFVYGLYTESPFYYFGFNYQDQLTESSLGTPDRGTETTGGIQGLYLSENGKYFYNLNDAVSNTSAYGELRDYMDLRSLFTVVIPYLKAANDVVRMWDDLYGLWLYDDVELEYNDKGMLITDPDQVSILDGVGSDSELYYKYWHNVNVSRMMNLYTPWVDTMYDCEYAKSETISVAGVKYTVEDPLNPMSYCKYDGNGNVVEGRAMVFSRSEMNYWGLKESDLTSVELKLVQLGENCYRELFQLMDYHTFNDRVLITAASMIQTFEFNKTFSQDNVIGKSYVLQPQGFALKNFTYDAYLRLILAESAGEDLQSSEGGTIYNKVVSNSSVFTALFMLVLDIIAVYIIPAIKLFFLMGIFLASILMILVATIKIEISLPSVLGKALVLPLVQFLGISIGMAFIVSLFMSNGNTQVTGRGTYTISLGDPTIAILLMIVINVVALVLYFRVVRGIIKTCKKYGKAVASSVSGTIGGSLAKVAGGALLATRVASSKVGSTATTIAKAPARAVSAISQARNNHIANKANRFAVKNDRLRKKADKSNRGLDGAESTTSSRGTQSSSESNTQSATPKKSGVTKTRVTQNNGSSAKSSGKKPIKKSGKKPVKKSKTTIK